MLDQITLLGIKRAILLFWATWLSVVVTTNVLNGLEVLGILPQSFKFVSGNWQWVNQVMDRWVCRVIYHRDCLGSLGSDTVLVCRPDVSRSAADRGKGDYLRVWR
jgi:hypothetical protein